MAKKSFMSDVIAGGSDIFLPGVSVNCVIFGFQDKSLKVLLTKLKEETSWQLPGRFVLKDEDLDETAHKVLHDSTQLEDIHIRQFASFGKKNRATPTEIERILDLHDLDTSDSMWYKQRFITIGYYALVQHKNVNINFGEDDTAGWFDIDKIPELFADHKNIIDSAIDTIRLQIGYIPIGYKLLPEKFTMPELRTIYECILGRELDRRNFQRKMLSIGFIRALNETRKSGAHKSPNLYAFDHDKYREYLENGLSMFTPVF